MKVIATSDWRDGVAFETPVVVADVFPGAVTRCSVCGSGSELRPRSELWAIKHRHPNDHGGHVRFYCHTHLPVVQRSPASPPAKRGDGPGVARARRSAPRATVTEKTRDVCPDCFVEIPATGVCGMCGRPVG